MEIPFTQFKMPDGRRVKTGIEMPQEIAEKAKRLIADGFVFEIEMLSTGQIAMEVYRDSDGNHLAMEICQNGPPVVDAVRKLVNDGYALQYQQEALCE